MPESIKELKRELQLCVNAIYTIDFEICQLAVELRREERRKEVLRKRIKELERIPEQGKKGQNL